MIISFKAQLAEDIFFGSISGASRRFPANLRKSALRKLQMLDAATEIRDLLAPPGNNLELLKGDLIGFYSIRINKQYRLIFRWENGNAKQVDILDYHK